MEHRMTCLQSVVLTLCLSYFSGAFANGAPVAWTGGTAAGGVIPKDENTIRLLEEDLHIALLPDLNHYSVKAAYILSNPGPAKTVTYGVPLSGLSLDTSEKGKRQNDSVARTIRISVGDASYRCRIAEVSRPVYHSKEEEEEAQDDPQAMENGSGWCVAAIKVPSGDRVSLMLEYRGELDYEDWEFSKSALTEFHHRTLRYRLSPAGYWRGPANRIAVSIDLGPYAGHVVKHNLLKAEEESQSIRWTRTQVDMKTLSDIYVELDGDELLRHRELVRWNHDTKPIMNATVHASSELPSQGQFHYDAKSMLDGDPKTAWCAGNSRDGIGEWFELRLTPNKKSQPYCRFEGIGLAAGVASSQGLYLENNRIRRLRVAHCDAPNDYRDIVIPSSGVRYDASALMIQLDDDTLLPVSPYGEKPASYEVKSPLTRAKPRAQESNAPLCYRFTILEVVRGTRYHDSCITELAPIFNCG